MRLLSRLIVSFAATALPGYALAANGCADGTYSRVQSPDRNSTSFLFDDFSATAGGSSGISRASSTCRLSVPVTQAEGHSVFAVDYRGYVSTQPGQAASVVMLKDGRAVVLQDITLPTDDDLSFSQRIGSSGSNIVELDVVVGATGAPDPGLSDAIIFLDSIDLARIGFTTTEAVVESANQVARQRQSIAVGLMDSALSLLGQTNRFDDGNSVSGFASSDAAAGFAGRWEAGDGLSLLAGAAIIDPNEIDNVSDTLALFAAAVRFTTAPSQWRAFGEVGAWASPNVSASLSRSYSNLNSTNFGVGSSSGYLFASYARAGLIFAPDEINEFALSTRISRSWLDLDGYEEAVSPDNLFAAQMKPGRSIADTISAELAWSRSLSETFDFTVFGAAGRTFARKNGVSASVDWVGDVRGTADDQNFGSVAGRVGWKFTQGWQADLSVSATFRETEKPAWNIGGQLKSTF
ncbi:DUF4360 domain-containing protein [Aliirhizobium smilacinae]|uniref:DUF4360 domain-containing protein n=1 Tax=Aliirhizobium smilacinae TaxID=1395944 RepID=UPI0015D64837|nr:DUF4360 domain-containing protein [Rhizobium smilacinae]